MTLDLVTSQRLVEPTPWEMERFRSAAKHERDDWHDVLDRASAYRWDDAVLRVVESEARREEHVRRWFMPAAAMCGGPRPNVFRALFQKDIGGVAGVSCSWFDASYYVVDGVSGKVSDWVDYIDPTHTLRQATSANQVAVPTVDAAMGGALTGTFAAASNNRYDSTRSPSGWRFWQDGSGVNVILVYVPNATGSNFYLSTRAGVVVTENGGLLGSFSGGSVRASFTNGTTTLWDTGNVGTTAVGTATYQDFSYSEGASPEAALRLKSSIVASGATASVPSAGDPQASLRIGSGTANLAPGNFRFRGLYVFRRALSSAPHRTIVQQWIQRETGITP